MWFHKIFRIKMYVESTFVSNRNFDVATTTSIQRWLLSRRRRDALSTWNRRWFDVVCPSGKYRCRRRTFWTKPRPINFSWEYYVGILMLLCKYFSAHVKKHCFLILYSVLKYTHGEFIHLVLEVRNSLLVNLVQKLSKSVNICKSYCKKFTDTFLWTLLWQCLQTTKIYILRTA